MNVAQKVESTDLVVFEKLTPMVVFAPGGVDTILEKIRNEVRSIATDISTKAGREAVASLAYKVARSKTALDKMGKELGENHYKSWKAITAERSRIETELDTLRDEVRKPLTDWENAEKKRINDHEEALATISLMGNMAHPEPTSEAVKLRIVAFSELPVRDWQEFGKRAADAMKISLATLQDTLAVAEKREADQAELARLRAEQIAREQKERDDRIAAEAAERARIEAEAKAAAQAAEAEAKARREAEEAAARAEAERKRIEQENADAIARAEAKAAAEAAAAEARSQAALKAAEEARHAAMLESVRAESERREAQLRADAAEASRVEQSAQAERDKKAAAEAAERKQTAALETERKRVADEAARVAVDTAKREADTKHRARINNEVLAALVDKGFSAEQGKIIVAAIAKGEIPHTRIGY